MSTIKDSLERSHAERFSGRERELARLATLFDPTGPLIVLLHGVGGIGKTSLVRVFERESAARGRQVRLLDCRGVEPVPLGLLGAIGTLLGVELRTVSEVADAVGALAEPMVFALDNYEALRLLDGWLRTEFLLVFWSFGSSAATIGAQRSKHQPRRPHFSTRHDHFGTLCAVLLMRVSQSISTAK